LNANENLGKKRNDARVLVKLGVIFISIGIIPFFCLYPLSFPVDDFSASNKLLNIPIIIQLYIEALLFLPGLFIVLLGLLLSLCRFLKRGKKEHLEKKRNNARALVKLGVVFMSIGIIPFCVYPIFTPVNQVPFAKNLPHIPPRVVYLSLCLEALLFVPGLVIVLLGRLKKRECL
jgi:amino acid transporter